MLHGWIPIGLEGICNTSSGLMQLHKPSDLASSLAELHNTANWILLDRTVKFLDGIFDKLGCVSTPKPINGGGFLQKTTKQ